MSNIGKKEIGLAIVGCGAIGRIRAIMARDYPGIGWLGLCDIDTGLGESITERRKGRLFYRRL